MNAPTTEEYKALGFKNTGFGSWVRSTELHVDIVVRPGHGPERFGVYVFHGAPGGAYWRSDAPLVRCNTLEEAQAKARTLYGITGSEQFANVVYL
jgi:hypothetical protein